MDSFNATISRLLEERELPKAWADGVVPAAAASTALAVGLGIVWHNSGSNNERRPPIVPSWIPWWVSEWAVESDPDAFFKAANELLPCVDNNILMAFSAPGQRHDSVIRGILICELRRRCPARSVSVPTGDLSTQLINQIYKQPKVFTISVVQLSWGKNCFSWSDGVLRKSSTFREEIIPFEHRNIAPKNMVPLVQSFAQNLSRGVKEYPTPTESVSLEEFVMRFARRATSVTWYGATLNIEEL